MIKVALLACIVLLGSAIPQENFLRNSFLPSGPVQFVEVPHNDSFITLPGSLPEGNVQVNNGTQNDTFMSFVQTYNGTQNDTFMSFAQVAGENVTTGPAHVPVSFVETELGQVTGNVLTRDLYACQSGYVYLSYTDDVNNRQAVCDKISYWGIYRLEGGGSADGTGYSCRSRDHDPRSLGSAVCVRTSVNSRVRGTGEDCPSGYDRVTADEINADKSGWCALLADWDIARIGVRDSMDGRGYGCTVRDWDDRGLGHSLCVKRNLVDIQTPDTNEDICGSGKSLLTVKEAMANRQTYCNLLPQWGIARLAGGASMDGPAYGCKVRGRDVRSLGHGVCGNLGRA